MACRVLGSMCMGQLPTDRHVSPAAGLQELQYIHPNGDITILGFKKGSHPRHFELAVQLKQLDLTTGNC